MELLERQVELETLARQLREAAASAGKLVFVCGEAGIGKSALVEQFVKKAPRTIRVLWGHCDALETSRVLGPVNEVVGGLTISPATGSGAAAPRERLFPEVLARLSPPNTSCIVVLEDLHWA